MNISLPKTVKEFADSEYIRDLIRDDEKRKTQEKLETLLPAGIEGSGPTEMTRQDWDSIRAEVEKASRIAACAREKRRNGIGLRRTLR